MTCPSCDALLEAGTRFCTACGFRIVADTADPSPAQTVGELLEGTCLRQISGGGPLHWRRVLELVEQICIAIVEARTRGIVNPELGPESIYVDHPPGLPWRVKLAAVSIELMRGDEPRDTATGRHHQHAYDKYGRPMPGLEYYPPERLMGKPLQGASDVFSLGIVAYELLSGRLPFPTDKGPSGMITAILKSKPLPPSALQADIPAEVDAVVLRCLNKVPVERYANVDALARAVADVLRMSSAGSSSVN